ncbi:MAG: nicotinate-nucleotide adenylyltransferase [Thermomicrobiales bacterium]|nr:nicotinate-nucleotide adenylyltransferase [Thermomicrobiales bacterium]
MTLPTATEQVPHRRVGVFGGTFDPIHNGHLHIAEGLRKLLDLDQIIWVLAGRPPHKRGQIVSSDEDRLAMLALALGDAPHDTISRIEVRRPGPSYTADTLEQLAAEIGPAQVFFLMGEDSLRDFPTWRDPERILRLADLGVAGRPGIQTDLADLAKALPELAGKVHVATLAELPVSSSEIRQRVAEGRSIAGLTPEPVARYIRDHGLYLANAAR